MGKIHWIKADSREPEVIEPSDKAPSAKEMQAFLGGWFEHVNVLYEGVWPTSMFVKDDGAVLDLPVNDAATKIYWAASATRGVDLGDKEQRDADSEKFYRDRGIEPEQVIDINPHPDRPPMIYGNAIVLEGIPVT